MNEKEILIKKYKKIEIEYRSVCKEVESLFFSLAREAINNGDLEKAKQLMVECPDTVVAAFIADGVRHAGGLNGKRTRR
jgi:hypothetical protein